MDMLFSEDPCHYSRSKIAFLRLEYNGIQGEFRKQQFSFCQGCGLWERDDGQAVVMKIANRPDSAIARLMSSRRKGLGICPSLWT